MQAMKATQIRQREQNLNDRIRGIRNNQPKFIHQVSFSKYGVDAHIWETNVDLNGLQ